MTLVSEGQVNLKFGNGYHYFTFSQLANTECLDQNKKKVEESLSCPTVPSFGLELNSN